MKKILLFVEELRTEFTYEIIKQIKEQAKNRDIDLDIIQNFNVYGSNILFSYGEKEIIHIPDFNCYDGICMLPDTFGLRGYEDTILAKAKTSPDIPIVSVRKETEGVYNILIDDYTPIYEMVEHFIVHHGFTKIAFMKGRSDLKDAQIRYQAYEDAMRKHNLPIKERFLFNGNYWSNMAVPAVDWFLGGEEKPEAIVCANDHMGVSILEELLRRGYKVPEDICVSGYDNLLKTTLTTPKLTSAGISFEELAKATVDTFVNIWEGNPQEKNLYLPSKCVFRNSCGCNANFENYNESSKSLYEENMLQNAVLTNTSFLFFNLDNARTFEDFLLTLPIHLNELGYDGTVCFCLNNKEEETMDSDPYTTTMVLKGYVDKYKAIACNTYFQREEIIPSFLREDDALVILNLHIKDESFGYLVFNKYPNKAMSIYLQFFAQAIINWFDKYNLLEQNDQLSKAAKYDSLTGIPTRKMINEHLVKTYQMMEQSGKEFFICSIDMDDLKPINDTYGHLYGDKALCEVANIIFEESKNIGLAARLGGDEYPICFNTDNEFRVMKVIDNIRKAIDAFNTSEKEPFKLSISIGYTRCAKGMLLNDCIKKADGLMYEEKKEKKKARIR